MAACALASAYSQRRHCAHDRATVFPMLAVILNTSTLLSQNDVVYNNIIVKRKPDDADRVVLGGREKMRGFFVNLKNVGRLETGMLHSIYGATQRPPAACRLPPAAAASFEEDATVRKRREEER